MTLPAIGSLVDAEYVTNLYGARAALRGVVISAAGPHTQFNASDSPAVSVVRPCGRERTSGSSLPVEVVADAGTPDARDAVRALLASGAYISPRHRAALEATL